MKYKYLMMIVCLLKNFCTSGQSVPAGTEIQELVKIASVYANIPNLKFDLKFTYADSLTWHDLTDSMTATCKMSYGRSLVSNSEMEVLRGTEYNVFVDKEDSIIIASPKQDFETVFQMPLLDSLFRETNVSAMNIIENNDSSWMFLVTFKPESYYSFYEMEYNPQNGLIRYINYHARNETGDHEIPADHIVCAFIYMSNYSDVAEDPVTFNEKRYFYLLNGTMYLQPAWQQYNIQN